MVFERRAKGEEPPLEVEGDIVKMVVSGRVRSVLPLLTNARKVRNQSPGMEGASTSVIYLQANSYKNPPRCLLS